MTFIWKEYQNFQSNNTLVCSVSVSGVCNNGTQQTKNVCLFQCKISVGKIRPNWWDRVKDMGGDGVSVLFRADGNTKEDRKKQAS